jgi:hypothetical protein
MDHKKTAAMNLMKDLVEQEATGEAYQTSGAWHAHARTGIRLAFGEMDPMMARFDSVPFSPVIWSPETPKDVSEKIVSGMTQVTQILSSALFELHVELEAEDHLTPKSIPRVHRWVFASSKMLGKDAGTAIREASRAIEIELRKKIGAKDQTFTDLVGTAFSSKAPEGSVARLRFAGYSEGTQEWTNVHDGTMKFGQGCSLRIRNRNQHGDHEISEQEGEEMLSALSLLARWIDDAEPVFAE